MSGKKTVMMTTALLFLMTMKGMTDSQAAPHSCGWAEL
jgi:hypothetical protein